MRKDGRVAGLRWWMPGWIRTLAVSMLTMDEPDHTRLPTIVDEAFRRRAVLEMEPRILAMADELAADLFTGGSPADLVERYARRLPLSVICELLGLPRADRRRFIAWANGIHPADRSAWLPAHAGRDRSHETQPGGPVASRTRERRRRPDRRASPRR
jgi:cytochrome P450